MNNVHFYLHKDKAGDFQNRCIVAIFLKSYPEITFIEYQENNSYLGFRGIVDGKEQQIYLFRTPPKDDTVPGFVYLASFAKKNDKHEYFQLKLTFMDEFIHFRSNIYEYIINHFFDDWHCYIGTLFLSNPPNENRKVYKYKAIGMNNTPNNKSGNNILNQYFENFLNGDITFVNPKMFNDPFDSDSEFYALESKQRLLWNAFNTLKYSGKGNVTKPIALNQIESEKDLGDKYIENIVRKLIEQNQKSNSNCRKNNEMIEFVVDEYFAMLKSGENLKEKFRIFCATDSPKDILMWGYYGNGGDGICCKYNVDDLLDGLNKQLNSFICVYGEVNYTDYRVKYEYKSDNLVDNIFQYVINCIFTKQSSWKNEHEFRYVLLEKNFHSDYISINSNVSEYIVGCKVQDEILEKSTILQNKKGSTTKLTKSTMEYKFDYY